MPFDTKTLKRDGSGITPVPQHFNPTADDYEPQYGRNGASRVEIYGPDGNPISTTSGKLDVRASEIESILTTIQGYVDGLEAALGEVQATPTTYTVLSRLKDLAGRLGEVSSAPTANTLLARLKNLETKVDAIFADGIKLSGSNLIRTKTILVNALAITDTLIHESSFVDVTGKKVVGLLVMTSLTAAGNPVDVNISLNHKDARGEGNNNAIDRIKADRSGCEIGAVTISGVNLYRSVFIRPDDLYGLNGMDYLGLRILCSSPPDAGSISIWYLTEPII